MGKGSQFLQKRQVLAKVLLDAGAIKGRQVVLQDHVEVAVDNIGGDPVTPSLIGPPVSSMYRQPSGRRVGSVTVRSANGALLIECYRHNSRDEQRWRRHDHRETE